MSAESKRLKMVSNSARVLLGLLYGLTASAMPGEKRTILTSGDKVYTIHYQLGQSTILYFGMKPETVICGNKNYFHIDKLKEGLAIQGVSTLSTNLTVLSQGKRFLFYLVPAGGLAPDAFVEVHWIPSEEAVLAVNKNPREVVKELHGRLRLAELEVQMLRQITVSDGKRSILEFEVRNSGRAPVKATDISVVAQKSGRVMSHQVSAFESDDIASAATIKGRLILTGQIFKGVSIFFKYKSASAQLQGVIN
jgi:hypothetical protein